MGWPGMWIESYHEAGTRWVVDPSTDPGYDRTLPAPPAEGEMSAGDGRVRPDWDHYFMGFAEAAAHRATCDRKRVGAVIVVDRQVVATGYNGSIRGMPHCDQVGHDLDAGHCVRTIHAEMNALAQAARHGVRVDGGSLYSTASPCWACFRVLANTGIRRYLYAERYREEEHRARILEVADRLALEVRELDG